jgi:hypothetical protein
MLTFRFGIKLLNDYPAWDFFPTYNAAKYIVTKSDIYGDLHISAQYTRSPAFALLLYPLGLFPRNLAAFIWCLLSAASLGLTFVLCAKLFVRKNKGSFFFWLVAAPLTLILLSRPMISQFLMGQVDLIMLLFVMLAIYFREKGRVVPAALFLALASSIKVTPLIFLPYFLFRRDFKLIGFYGIFSLAILFLPAPFVSWKHNLSLLGSWFHNLYVFYPHEATTPQDAWYQSLYFFLKRFVFSDKFNISLFNGPAEYARYLNYLLFAMLYLFVLIRPRRDKGISMTLIDYNILVISMVIFSPLAADYTYMNLAVPIVFLLYAFKDYALFRHPVFAVSAAVFLILNYFTGNKAFRLIGINSIGGESYCYLVVMTLVWQALVLLFLLLMLKYNSKVTGKV